MAVEQLRPLLERTGRSARSLEIEAGAPEGRLAYWLRPTTVVHGTPPVSKLEELATILGADLVEVSRAFAAAAGLILDDISDDEFALVVGYRRLSRRDQHTLRTMDAGELELVATLRQLSERDRDRLRAIADVLHDGE